eukprot:359920-Chlamydomonas_euryale.AAC.3
MPQRWPDPPRIATSNTGTPELLHVILTLDSVRGVHVLDMDVPSCCALASSTYAAAVARGIDAASGPGALDTGHRPRCSTRA